MPGGLTPAVREKVKDKSNQFRSQSTCVSLLSCGSPWQRLISVKSIWIGAKRCSMLSTKLPIPKTTNSIIKSSKSVRRALLKRYSHSMHLGSSSDWLPLVVERRGSNESSSCSPCLCSLQSIDRLLSRSSHSHIDHSRRGPNERRIRLDGPDLSDRSQPAWFLLQSFACTRRGHDRVRSMVEDLSSNVTRTFTETPVERLGRWTTAVECFHHSMVFNNLRHVFVEIDDAACLGRVDARREWSALPDWTRSLVKTSAVSSMSLLDGSNTSVDL